LPAAAAIDWSMPGQRIGDRTKPLADKTRARIAAGLAKYGHRAPFVAVLRTHADARPIVMPFATFVAGTVGQALVVPVEGRDGKAARSAVEELRTQTARSETGLAFLVRHYTPRGRLEQMCTGLDAPLPTQTASFVPWIVELRGGHSGPRPVEDPLSTVSANGNHHLLVVPPGFVMRNNGSVGDGGEHCTPLDEELRTLTTAGHQSVVTAPLLMSYYGNGDTRPVDLPMGTATTVDRHALLVPAGGTWNEDASHAGEPMRTRTTRDTEALVDVDGLDVDDCCFRMLEPAEIKLGMAFDAGYLLLGNRREQVRLAGNAVTPPAARDIAGIVIEALTGEAVA
jgi:DNA (cytosine-5)-methyltransferase 1